MSSDAHADPAHAANPVSTVLVVDDNQTVRQMVCRFLKGDGLDVLEASGADEALALDQPVDLLVTDIKLPGMDGMELAERLAGRWPSLKVLFMSGYLDGVPPGASRPGRGAFLQKPFTLTGLLDRVRGLLAA